MIKKRYQTEIKLQMWFKIMIFGENFDNFAPKMLIFYFNILNITQI
jgi:hypothetical protein